MTTTERARCRRTGKLIFASSAEAMREVMRVQARRAAGEIRHRPGKEGRVERRSYPLPGLRRAPPHRRGRARAGDELEAPPAGTTPGQLKTTTERTEYDNE